MGHCEDCKWWGSQPGPVNWCRRFEENVDWDKDKARVMIHTAQPKHDVDFKRRLLGALEQRAAFYTRHDFGCNQFEEN